MALSDSWTRYSFLSFFLGTKYYQHHIIMDTEGLESCIMDEPTENNWLVMESNFSASTVMYASYFLQNGEKT